MTTATAFPDVVERVTTLLAREAGIACPPSRERELLQALDAGRREADAPDLAAYVSLLEGRPALVDDLVDAVSVGETYFFRDPAQFALLRDHILPELVREHGTALRLWSAGCASGEEAYSLAIVLAEAGITPAMPVLGTDISRAALRRAEAASYGNWSFRGVPEAVCERYFVSEGGRLRLVDEIRRRVRFEWLNLAASTYPSPHSGVWGMHVIFCRNVLIYLTPDAVAAVARGLYAALAPGGWLVTSPTDPSLAELAPFTPVVGDGSLVYRRDPLGDASSLADPDGPDSALRAVGAAVLIAAPRPRPVTDEAWRRGPETQPLVDAIDTLRDLARARTGGGDLAEAERVLTRAVAAHPLDAELRYLSAVLFLELGRDAEAAAAARQAVYLEPGLAVAAVALGSALRRVGDLRGARRAYRTAAAILAQRPPEEELALGDGERAGGLLRTVQSLLALAEVEQ